MTKKLYEILIQTAKERGEEIITKEIPFINDDVPKYLKMLKEFEEKSKKTSLYIGNQQVYNH